MPDKPNFLFFFPDQHRGDWMPYRSEIFQKLGMEDLPLRMPNIKKLMESGVTFTNAITPSPLCAPARACLAAGLRYKNCRVATNQENYPTDQKTYYTVLKDAGYVVASVGKLDIHKHDLFWGTDGWVPELGEIGFTQAIDNEGKWDAVLSVIRKKDKNGKYVKADPREYRPKGPYMKYLAENNLLETHIQDFMNRLGTKKMFSSDPTPLPEESYCDNWITTNVTEMLRHFPKHKPWHLVVNFVCPHDPWDITKSMKKSWESILFPKPFKGNVRSIDQEIKVRQNYAAMLENIDKNIGLFIDKKKKRGELENTIIIYSSDHGEMLGDFRRYNKMVPERGSTKIPLVISGPGIIKGLYKDSPVELQDVTSTIIDYAGAKMEEAKDSISLRPILEGKKEVHRKYHISAFGGWKMISDGEYKLIVEENNKIRLYYLIEDPWENTNIAVNKPQIVDKLINELNLEYKKK
ncbi:MAG: sulfatase family protein [Promethearchaeota archaeon]